MYTIKKKGSRDIPVITITDYVDMNGYCPRVDFNVVYDEQGFHVHFDVYEKNPRREEKENFGNIWHDSCVEWFVIFDSEHCERYFNFEVNANAKTIFAFRLSGTDYVQATEEDAKSLGIKTEILDDRWTVDYTVPFSLIKKYIPDYEFKPGMILPSNVYKCGDETDFPHFGCWKMVDREKPNFHKPEYFGKMIIG